MNKLSLAFTTTVVGSFPKDNTPSNMEAAFQEQIDAGVNYPCYPQLVSMIDQFLDPLSKDPNSGLVKKDGRYYLEKELKIPKEPVALEYGKFVIDFFKKHPEAQKKVKGWKACLTGPFTLAGEIHIPEQMLDGQKVMVYAEPRAIMNGKLVEKLAEMMAGIAKAYDSMGATIISMDEPTLALIVGKRKTFFHADDFIVNTLNKAIAPISKYSSIHICGNVAPKLRDILLKSNVKIMDHEFANGSNDGIFEKSMFAQNDKMLAYGVLITNLQEVPNGKLENYAESVEIIKSRIKKAVDTVGKENLILKPDCGFGGLKAVFGEKFGSEIVHAKLSNLSKALKEF
jgi:5-methyltetrahydropteroyltriglutamate--homocysteine methyltransferase